MHELPASGSFPEVERAEWINGVIERLWPIFGHYAKKVLVEGSKASSFRFLKANVGKVVSNTFFSLSLLVNSFFEIQQFTRFWFRKSIKRGNGCVQFSLFQAPRVVGVEICANETDRMEMVIDAEIEW